MQSFLSVRVERKKKKGFKKIFPKEDSTISQQHPFLCSFSPYITPHHFLTQSSPLHGCLSVPLIGDWIECKAVIFSFGPKL